MEQTAASPAAAVEGASVLMGRSTPVLLSGVLALAGCLGFAGPLRAQAPLPADPLATIDADAPLLTRDADGRVTVRATRITTPISIDGRLDDSAYQEVRPITDFVQQEPDEGAPGTERTEAWILFDDRNIYLACRCWDSNPEGIVANDMRRDSQNLNQHDSFGVHFDPFNDGRSGFYFYMTPVGGARDAVTTDARPNNNWNGVWDWEGSRFDEGWIAEMAIPFKSLRYRPGREQTWRIQIRRLVRSKNERVHLTRLSAAWGPGGWNRMSEAATLVGLEAPPASMNLEIKPYVNSSLTTDVTRTPVLRNDFDPEAGFDVKYGVTKSTTLDFTYNTDFAQVEADEAQVNLTRFSITFPEKRDFFLEGEGAFAFGRVTGGSGPESLIFYSRRIGLAGGQPLPVIAGGRLTGKAGPWTVGALNIEVDDLEAVDAAQTNFTVLSLRRNILRRSSIGGIYTRRSVSTIAPGANDVWGLDANLGFFDHLNLGGFVARSRTETLEGDDLNYELQVNYDSDRYGLAIDREVAGENFNPEVGFLRREDFRRNFLQARFSPRTTTNPLVRKWSYEASVDYVTDNDNRLESRALVGEFQAQLHSGDSLTFRLERLHESPTDPFALEDVVIPPGSYSFNNAVVSVDAGQQHRVSGRLSLEAGGFFGGFKQTAEYNGRIDLGPQLGIEPNISLNWIDLPQGAFTTTLVGGRTTFTMTPRMFVSALVQYSSTSILTNLRFRWEYQPGSELFVVYTEGRSTLPTDGTELQSRGLVFKVNRLFRF